MDCLVSYDCSSNEDNSNPNSPSSASKDHEKKTIENISQPPATILKSTLVKTIDSAPVVDHKAELMQIIPVHPGSRELICNPTYDELFAPIAGPANPFKSEMQASLKNMLTGYVEEAHMNEFHFENQRRTFDAYGYAIDPTNKDHIVGDIERYASNQGKTVAEAPKKGRNKRKRLYNLDPASEDFTGPWAPFEDEVFDSYPAEDDQVYLDAFLTKRSRKHMRVEQAAMDEKTQLHIADPNDYQGRSFLHPPHDIDGVNFRANTAPDRCYLPKRQIYEWNQAHPKGVSVLKLFPQTGHLMLSGGFDSKIKLWEVYNERRLIRSYLGHRQAVRDVDFNNDGTQFLSCSYDRFAKQWDTETGKAINQFNLRKVAFCIKHNPDQDKQHLFLVGCADKKILCYDSRSGEVVQTYDRHLGAVNTVTFVDENRRFISTSDDKSLRIWEWDIPVDFKYIADPSMHSMPAVRVSPNAKYILCQSLDNSISVINIFAGFKRMRKKIFRGHMVSGYACTMDFSPDQRYIISGDGDGMLCLWEWKSCRLLNKWKAHDSVCLNSHWLPHETSKIITSSWDGNIKLWD